MTSVISWHSFAHKYKYVQVVIMDQPTRSLDLVSRKQFWDMMHKRQKGRVILFTTDSMEEADVVADRKAVLSHGVLKCCGSSFFLRNRFGNDLAASIICLLQNTLLSCVH
jgi:ABC-type multidrug transport system ATPase subunit